MTTEELQAQKLQLEIDKLNTDIDKANLSWYKNSEFWKSLIPTLITTSTVIASLYFTVGRSFIDDEKRKLELQKEQLKLEVLQFSDVKADIQKQITGSIIDKNSLNKQILLLSRQRQQLSYGVVALKQKTKILVDENKNLKFKYADDTAFYHNELKKAYLYQKQYLQKLSDENTNKDARIASLLVGYNFLRKKANLNTIESSILAADMSEASAKVFTQKAIEYHKKPITPKSKSSKIKTSKDFERWLDLYFLGKTDIE